jgi:hypothetical protein
VKTDVLIDRLTTELKPVRPLGPAWIRATVWLAIGLPPLAAVAMLDGITVSPASMVADPYRFIEFAAILATAVTAGAAAFASTIPGSSRGWVVLPVLPLAIWLMNLGKACVEDMLRFGSAGLLLRIDGPCFPALVAMSVVPTLTMWLMLRRGAPFQAGASYPLAALSIAALTNIGLKLIHGPYVSLMALAWSFLLIGILYLVSNTMRRDSA